MGPSMSFICLSSKLGRSAVARPEKERTHSFILPLPLQGRKGGVGPMRFGLRDSGQLCLVVVMGQEQAWRRWYPPSQRRRHAFWVSCVDWHLGW